MGRSMLESVSPHAASGPDASSAPPESPASPPLGKRQARSEATREALLRAASEVVGERGYAEASIALITQRAGVGQGTFYNYFPTRQAILDELLPRLGRRMLQHVRDRAIRVEHRFAPMEEASFRAFFEFLRETPEFTRVLMESEFFAPEANEAHFDMIVEGYTRFLGRSWREGAFPAYEEDELETIAFLLMAARLYLARRHQSADPSGALTYRMPERVIRTYLKFIRFGLQGQPTDRNMGG